MIFIAILLGIGAFIIFIWTETNNKINMKIIPYLQSKTIQGILGLVALGILKNYHVTVLDDQTLATLAALFAGWLGIGIRDAIKPIAPQQ